jgi:hypothetical protein
MGNAALGNGTDTQTTEAGTDATSLEVHHVH